MSESNHRQDLTPAAAATHPKARRGAAGKALLVWIGTGSIGAAVVAYLLFHSMGC